MPAHRVLSGRNANLCEITAIMFLADGQRLVTTGSDGNIALWDLGKQESTVVIAEPWVMGDPRHQSLLERVPVGCLALDAQQRYVAGGTHTTVNLWELGTATHIREYGKPVAKELIGLDALGSRSFISADAAQLRMRFQLDKSLLPRSPDHLQHWQITHGSGDGIRQVAVVESQQRMIGAHSDKVFIWDLPGGQKLHSLQANAFAVSVSEELLATSYRFRRCSIYNLKTQEEQPLEVYGRPVGFMFNDQYLVLSAASRLVLYDLHQNKTIPVTEKPQSGEVASMVSASASPVLASLWGGVTRNNVRVYRLSPVVQ